jgi:hypothetical protein
MNDIRSKDLLKKLYRTPRFFRKIATTLFYNGDYYKIDMA